MAAAFTDFDVWDFKREESGRWSWQRLSPDGEALVNSRASHNTFEECVADAERAGYTGRGQKAAERSSPGSI
jgi:hypothetical protein